jgi:hypothetical protein
VPHVGHSVLTADTSGCALAGATAFLAGQAPAARTAGPRFAAGPYRPAALRDPAAAVRMTLEGVRHDLAAARLQFGRRAHYMLPGLRSGSTRADRGRLALRAVEWFRGTRSEPEASRSTRG